MRVVLDTNVTASGLNFPGNERLLLDLARRGRFEWHLSPLIVDEVAGVLARKFGWAEARVSQAIRVLREAATIIEPLRILKVIESDHADNHILACAVDARADYLITGDRRHLLPPGEHRGVSILSPPRFLSALRPADIESSD